MRTCRPNRVLMRRTKAFSGPYFQRAAPGICAKAGHYWFSPGSPGYFPWQVTYTGDGWRRTAIRAFQFQAGVALTPAFNILPLVAGQTYRVSGLAAGITGTLPQIRVYLGDDLTETGTIVADGVFSFEGVAGTDNNECRFVVMDRTGLDFANLYAVQIEDITP